MGYLYALLAAFLFGANGSLSKVVMASGLTAWQLSQFRVVGMALIAGAVLIVADRRAFRIDRRRLLAMVVLGVVGVALLQATYAVAVSLLPVGIALLLEYLAVLIVALVAFFFLKERVKARLWVAIGFVLVGLAVVAQIWHSTLDGVGVLMALAAAVTLAVYFLVGERQVAATSPLAVAFWTGLFAAVFLAFVSGWWEVDPALFAESVSLTGSLSGIVVPFWAALLWLVVAGSFLPFLLSLAALGRLSATAAGIVASSEVIFAFVVAWLWLGEELNVPQLIGAAIVLVGIVLAQTARADKVVDADLAITADVGRPG
jgi:drug/metabolite transporter (DMT)-like permease